MGGSEGRKQDKCRQLLRTSCQLHLIAAAHSCKWLCTSVSVHVCMCVCVCVLLSMYVFMCAIHGSTDPRLVLRVYCQVITFTRVVLAVFVSFESHVPQMQPSQKVQPTDKEDSHIKTNSYIFRALKRGRESGVFIECRWCIHFAQEMKPDINSGR